MLHLLKKLLSSSPDPTRMRLKQYGLMGGVMGGGLLLLYWVTQRPLEALETAAPEDKKQKVRLDTPFDAINPRDVWVDRVEKEAEAAKAEAKAVRQENALLSKKMEVLEKLFQEGERFKPARPQGFIPPVSSDLKGQENSPHPSPLSSGPPLRTPGTLEGMTSEEDKLFGPPPAKILHKSLPEGSQPLLKNIDNYVPAGSYARAVLTSGVVASTALQASSHPQPLVLRLVDEGHLPSGFKGTLEQNVLISACYGDLSSERVMCRLETMSWVKEDGITVEKKVEGWIIGEDGRPGLRGEVVDRSGEAVRDTMIAGLLSGLGQFLKAEATSSIYPVSPFGQTNALSGQRALEGAAATGASSALDKLVEFSIKRAEQMQPVILIASGRVVDVIFKTGVDLRPETAAPSLTLIHNPPSPTRNKNHEDH